LTRPSARTLGAGIFAALALARNTGVWTYLINNPASLGWGSLRLWVTDALLPLFLAGTSLAVLSLPVRRLTAWAGGLDPTPSAEPGADAGGMLQGLLGGVLAFCAWHAMVLALAPPTEWDVLAYHLAIPKHYLRIGLLREIPWMLHSHWPHLMETLYALPLALGLDQVPAVLHAGICGLWVWAVFRAGRGAFGASAGWVAAALLAVQPAVLRTAGTAHSDGAMSLFFFFSCLCLWRWLDLRSTRWAVMGGLAGGLAASCKLIGLAPPLLTAAWLVVSAFPGGPSRRERGRAALTFTACAVLVALPWYLKAWTGAGNPVWPLFSGVLGGRWGASAVEASLLRSNVWTWPPDPAAVLRYGPQYLLLPAFGFWAWARARGERLPGFLRFLLVPAVPYLLLVSRYHEGWRFLMPFYPALALLAGWGLSRLLARPRWEAALLLAAGLLPVFGASQNNQLFAVLGLRSASAPGASPRVLYLDRSLDHHAFYREAGRLLRPGAKVLLFREIRGYYLDADYMWGDPLNQGLIRYAELEGPDALGGRLAELGVTHVLVNGEVELYRESPGYYDGRTLALMEDLLSSRGRPVLRKGALALYAL